MKLSLILSALLCSALTTTAQTRTRVTINEATVFLRGAQLSSSATVSLPAGESVFLFSNIAGNINTNSINVGTDAEVAVQSASFNNDYLGDSSVSPRVRQLKDSISLLQAARRPIADRKLVVSDQLEILRNNRDLTSGKNGLSALELQKLLDLAEQRTEALLSRKRSLDSQDEVIDRSISKLQLQLGEEQQKGFQPGGMIAVTFYAQKPITTKVNLSYVTLNAGWSPAYDLRVERINDPVRLFYKAHVFQNSGVKWDKVRLTLSTGNPQESAEAPMFLAQYLAPVAPEPAVTQLEATSTRNSMDMATLSTQSYQASRGEGIAIGGARSSASKIIIDGVQQNPGAAAFISGVSTHTVANDKGISSTFDIDLPYDIPSDGQQHTVAVKTYDLPATYRYYAAPRQDRDVFLQARVTNWEDLNLVAAPTNIFFEGRYVGQGYIHMRNVRDTMNLSLGRDKKIIVNRVRDLNYRVERVIGTNVKQTYAWSISVRNTRTEPITLQLVDQIPLSTRNDVSIDDIKTPGTSMDERTGRLEWNLTVRPAETQKLTTSYTLRYPKGHSVAGL